MLITVMEDGKENETILLGQLTSMAPHHFALSDKVPGIDGQAFDLKSWYAIWNTSVKPDAPTHMQVEAADEFQATIPWGQLDHAAFLYEQNGAPLTKGYPLRLYVPDGSSQCLNVKSVVKLSFLHRPELGDEATYGFVNAVSPDQLLAGPGKTERQASKEEAD